MSRPSRKQVLVWAVVVLVLAGLLSALPPVRTEYHKWRLNSNKARKARLLGAAPAGLDRFWLHVAGRPITGAELDQAIHEHEYALVKLGFLERHKLSAQMVAACPQAMEALTALQSECPWYHAETVSSDLLLTACPKMMDRWRKRTQELGL